MGINLPAAPAAPDLNQPADYNAAVLAGFNYTFNTLPAYLAGVDAADWFSVLGGVSQSGGVPTGAIMQRGSNANGDFTRFADGRQICVIVMDSVDITTAVGGLYKSDPLTWTFPAAFLDDKWTGGGRIKDGGAGLAVHLAGAGTTAPSSIIAYATGSTAARTVILFAIGRWF